MIKQEYIETNRGQILSTDLSPGSGFFITRICDDCGEEHKMRRSKYVPVCRKCNTPKMSKARKDLLKTTCPKCGEIKSYSAITCYKCGEIKSYSAITCYKCAVKRGKDNPMFGVILPENHPLRERNKQIAENPELHHNWKGGKGGRTGKQIKWARDVKESYKHICDCCGYIRIFALEAHHYELSEAKYWKNSYDISNGVSLCSNCHKEFHKIYGYGNNTKQQYIKFKENYHG